MPLPFVRYSEDDDLKEKRHRLMWKYHVEKPITCVSITPSGHRVVMGCSDNHIYFFDKTNELIWDFNCDSEVYSVCVSERGEKIAVGTQKEVILLNKRSEIIWRKHVVNSVSHVLFAHKGEMVIAGSKAKKIYFYNPGGNIVSTFNAGGEIGSIIKTKDDRFVVASSRATIMLFTGMGKHLWNYKTKWNIESLAFSKTGKYIISSAMMSIYCLNLRSELVWKTTGKSVGDVLKISSNNDYILRGGRDGIMAAYNLKGDVMWQYKTGSTIASSAKPVTKGITAITISKNGEYIALGAVNKKVTLLSQERELIYRFECDDDILAIESSDVGDAMVVASGKTIYFLDNTGLYPALFEDCRNAVTEAEQYKLDTSHINELYMEAHDSYRKKVFSKVSAQIWTICNEIETQKKVKIKTILPRITNEMVECAKKGYDLERVKKLLSNAKELYKRKLFYQSIDAFNEVLWELNILRTGRKSSPPPRKVSAVQPPKAPLAPSRKLSPQLELKPIEPQRLEKQVPEFQKLRQEKSRPQRPELQKFDFQNVAPEKSETRPSMSESTGSVQSAPKAQVPKVPRKVEKPVDKRLKVEALKNIDLFLMEINRQNRTGGNTDIAEKTLRQVRMAAEKGDFSKSIQMAQGGMKALSRSVMREKEQLALEYLTRATKRIQKAKKMDINTSEYQATMGMAVSAFEKKLYSECIIFVEKLESSITHDMRVASPEYKETRDEMETLKNDVIALKDGGLNTILVEDILSKCERNLEDDVALVKRLLVDAREIAEGLKKERGMISQRFKDVQTTIEAMGEEGYSMTLAQNAYHDGLIGLYSGDMKKAVGYLEKAISAIEKIKSQDGNVKEDDPLVASLKNLNAEMEGKIEEQIRMMETKDRQMEELDIVIRDLKEKIKEIEAAQPIMRSCNKCKRSIPENYIYCGFCGDQFEKYCSKCESVLVEGFQFCGKCGHKVE